MSHSTQPDQRSEERWRALVANSPDFVVCIDEATERVTFVNRAAPGLTVEQFVGRVHWDFVPPEHRPMVTAAMARARASKEGVTFETGGPGPHGRPSHYESRIVPVLRDGRIVEWISIMSDVTERRRLEAHIAEVQKLDALGALAGGVAHDFNNLLAVVRMGCNAARSRSTPGSEVDLLLREIDEASARAAELTGQILAFSRGQPMRLSEVDVNEAVRSMARLVSRTLGEKLRVEVACDAQELRAMVDAVKLDQVILNLCTNAAEAMEGLGTLTLRTRLAASDDPEALARGALQGRRHAEIVVRDDGPGMGDEIRRRALEPFFTTKPAGTGLGLAVSYGIVRQHGGCLDVASEPGRGTTVTIFLPLVDEAGAAESRRTRSSAPPGGPETILVADDDALVLQSFARVLAHFGYAVVRAGGGAEAVAAFEAQADGIALAILDMSMPDVDGPEAIARMRAIRPDLPAILLTGHAREQALERATALGVEVMTKPFSIDEMGRRVRALLDGASTP